MEKKNKKSILFGMILLVLVTITLLGLTYAYYRTRVIGNDKTSISVSTKNLELTYHDGNSYLSMEGHVEPGFYATKDFSVENTGESSLNYDIVIDNIVNTFSLENSWKYILYKVDSDSKEKLTEGYIDDYFEILTLKSNILINPTELINFQIYIEYVDSGEDQSVDMGSKLSLRVNIRETSKFELAEEGTLLYAIREGNDVVKPVTTPGKTSSGLSFSSDSWSEVQTDSYTSSNYIAYSDSYEFDKTTGTFTLVNPTIELYSDCYSKLKGKYTNWRRWASSTPDIRVEGMDSIYYIVDANSGSFSYKEPTVNIVTTDEKLVSSTEDDYGTSFYYRGNVNNNFVNFAGMCWRIVRIDGNGNVKIILADRDNLCDNGYSETNTTSAFVADPSSQTFRYSLDNYLEFEKSDVYSVLQAWINGGSYKYLNSEMSEANGTFEQHISNDDQRKLVNAEWCQDFSVHSIDDSRKETYYSSEKRLGNQYDTLAKINANPTLKCDMTGINNTKATTVNSIVGLLTADELVFAGAAVSSASGNSYIKANANFENWTITPYGIGVSSNEGWNHVFFEKGAYLSSPVSINFPLASIRPTVVLKNDVEITVKDVETYGEAGTSGNPYVVS